MTTRKQFIVQGTLTTGITMLGLNALAEEKENKPTAPTNIPLIVATWDRMDATNAGWQKMQAGGGSLDGVEAGARWQEANREDMSVGLGGLPDATGVVTLDSCIMDYLGNAGSVAFLQNIEHPVSVARRVMEKTPHELLVGDGAYEFAIKENFPRLHVPLSDAVKKKWEEIKAQQAKDKVFSPKPNVETHHNHDTIGVLAIDKDNRIAGACTTSGLANKMHGRVGDSPIIGAGMFVDDEVGGAVATGVGELSLKTLGSFLIVELMRQGKSPQQACEEAIHRVTKKYKYQNPDLQLGFLAINKAGESGSYAIRTGFIYARYDSTGNKVIKSDSFLK